MARLGAIVKKFSGCNVPYWLISYCGNNNAYLKCQKKISIQFMAVWLFILYGPSYRNVNLLWKICARGWFGKKSFLHFSAIYEIGWSVSGMQKIGISCQLIDYYRPHISLHLKSRVVIGTRMLKKFYGYIALYCDILTDLSAKRD